MKKNVVGFLLFFCLVSTFFASTEAMRSIVIENKMQNDLLIDSFSTSGSAVLHSLALRNTKLKEGDNKTIDIEINSPVCENENNYVLLGINPGEKLIPVAITWGDSGVYLDSDYVVQGKYRITQYSGKGVSTIITFYDYETPLKEALITKAISNLRDYSHSQQVISEGVILEHSGVRKEELVF